jgi:hypothetical protein
MVVRWSFDGRSMVVRWSFDGRSMVVRWSFDGRSMMIQETFNGRSTVRRSDRLTVQRILLNAMADMFRLLTSANSAMNRSSSIECAVVNRLIYAMLCCFLALGL